MNKFTWPEAPRPTAYPVARAGYPFIFTAAFVTAVLALLGLTLPTLISLLATFAICGFFRDPDRVIPDQATALVSPADGKVIAVGAVEDSPFYDGPAMKISIFMSVFNVHVNRVPFNGMVKKISYFPGKFFSANLDKASRENEHNAVFIEMENGKPLCVVQIAGLIARRIICTIQAGERLTKGQRFGLICFGSRLDVYLPTDIQVKVVVGDTVRAGASTLGEFED